MDLLFTQINTEQWPIVNNLSFQSYTKPVNPVYCHAMVNSVYSMQGFK